MEHNLQKKQELELWDMVSRGKPKQGQKTPSSSSQRMKQELPNHFPFKKSSTDSQTKKGTKASNAFL